MTNLMRYIPSEYKKEVKSICRSKDKEWNEITRCWSNTITVEWTDGEVSEYQNSTYMYYLLKEFGR